MKTKLVSLGSALVVGLGVAGCTVTRFKANDTTVTTYTVAYPWYDTMKQLDKATLDTKTNSSKISLAGYAESETASTNAAALFERGIGAAVNAAVKAVKP